MVPTLKREKHSSKNTRSNQAPCGTDCEEMPPTKLHAQLKQAGAINDLLTEIVEDFLKAYGQLGQTRHRNSGTIGTVLIKFNEILLMMKQSKWPMSDSDIQQLMKLNTDLVGLLEHALIDLSTHHHSDLIKPHLNKDCVGLSGSHVPGTTKCYLEMTYKLKCTIFGS